MTDTEHVKHEQTAVDDVRRVREKIARKHGGSLREHVAETNRIAEKLKAKLKVRLVPAPKHEPRRSGTQG